MIASIMSALGFPAGTPVPQFWIYDNLATVNKGVTWDSNADGMIWLEILATTSQGKATRMRCLVRTGTVSIVTGLPRAVVYADTGITLLGTSDVYAVKADGTPITDGTHPTTVMAGTYFTANSSSDLAGPGSATSLWVSAPTGRSRRRAMPSRTRVSAAGTVGLLSDYFDQSEQAALADEAQPGSDMSLYNLRRPPLHERDGAAERHDAYGHLPELHLYRRGRHGVQRQSDAEREQCHVQLQEAVRDREPGDDGTM